MNIVIRFIAKRVIENNMNHQRDLYLDLMVYGQSFEEKIKSNFIQKSFRFLIGLPMDKKRIDPRNVRLSKK